MNSTKTQERGFGPSEILTSESILKRYLQEMGEVKLLSREEEIELAIKIKKGSRKAREQMIKANLRLVFTIARHYEHCGLPLLDLINEGNIGLIKAVERFRIDKGAKFSTYAIWWIKQSIKRALANQSRTIRLPVHMVDRQTRMRRAEREFRNTHDRAPTYRELARRLNLPIDKVIQLKTVGAHPISLQSPSFDDESTTISEIIEDIDAENPYRELASKTTIKMLRQFIDSLDDRERTIILHRFGIGDREELTLQEIGNRYGVTRERIRQIQNIALAKLRSFITEFEKVQKN